MRTASTAPDRPNVTYRPRDLGTLVVTLDGEVVQAVPLGARAVTIGRLPENVVALPHQSVSRRHAEVRAEGTVALLTDVGSAGGTFVDGVRLVPSQPCALVPGSTGRVGPYVLTYTAPAPALSPLADAPAPAPVAPAPNDGAREMGGRGAGLPALLEEAPAPVAVRPRWPAARAHGPTSRYLHDLPTLFQENDFLGRMLLIFESIWEPLEQRQDHFPLYFDPRTCPAELLPWLAAWLELQLDPHWPEARRRALVGEATELYRWRGTPYGLTRMIEVCTGLTPTITEDPARPFTFRVALTIPRGHDVRREVIEELVRAHKPAHVGYVLEVAS